MMERFIDTEEFLHLPLSGRQYKVNIKGIVKDANDAVIYPEVNELGEKLIYLNWYKGLSLYPLIEIIAHTFKPVKVPSKYWKELKVVRMKNISNDRDHPSNLIWKFPIGLGEKDNNGFAYIPMFTRYLINRDGVIFDRGRWKLIHASISKGYYAFFLSPDVGPYSGLKRHRAVCLAFTDYPINVDHLQVNHKNGRPGDDILTNLEWATGSENRQHAVDNNLTAMNKPVLTVDMITGEQKTYNTLYSFCRTFKLSEPKVSKLLANVEVPYYIGNLLVKYKYAKQAILKNTNSTPIKVKDLKTGIISEYESIAECSRVLSISKDVIQWRLLNKNRLIYTDGLLFKRRDDTSSWYETSDFNKDLLQNEWTKITLIKDLVSGQVIEFDSQRSVSEYLKIAEATVVQRVTAVNQPVYLDEIHSTYILMVRKKDFSGWRTVSNAKEEYEKTMGYKKVIVKNVLEGTIKQYSSAIECAKDVKILPTTLNWRLKSEGQKLFDDGLLFKYSTCEKEFVDVDETLIQLMKTAPKASNRLM